MQSQIGVAADICTSISWLANLNISSASEEVRCNRWCYVTIDLITGDRLQWIPPEYSMAWVTKHLLPINTSPVPNFHHPSLVHLPTPLASSSLPLTSPVSYGNVLRRIHTQFAMCFDTPVIIPPLWQCASTHWSFLPLDALSHHGNKSPSSTFLTTSIAYRLSINEWAVWRHDDY